MTKTLTNRHAAFALSAVAFTMLIAMSVFARQSTSADIRRLDQLRQDVQTELRRVETQSNIPTRLLDDLDDLRDEVGYLSVLQRRGDNIDERQYRELETRLQSVRREMRAAGTGAAGSGLDARSEIQAGTELDVRLQNRLNSDTAAVEDRFEATTVVDLNDGERLLVPAGSVVRGLVTGVDRASRTDRRGSLTVVFDELTVYGRTYDIRANVVQALEAGIKGEAGKIGAGAGVGAIIGGILGGTKGALAGVLIGAGGTVLATEGKDVDLPVGTIMRVRFESPVQIQK